jgi:hypothetical protein
MSALGGSLRVRTHTPRFTAAPFSAANSDQVPGRLTSAQPTAASAMMSRRG